MDDVRLPISLLRWNLVLPSILVLLVLMVLLGWTDLFDGTIDYARNEMPVSRSLADWLAKDAPILREFLKTAKIFLAEGEPQ